MAGKYVIDAIFNIIDGATAPLHNIGKAADAAGKKSMSASAVFNRDVANAKLNIAQAGVAFKNMGKVAFAATAGAVAAGLAVATKQYIEFDNAVKASGALFKDLDPTAEGFNESLEAIGAKAREVAGVTEFNAVDTAGALSKMAMAGMDSKTSMALLAGTTDLATAAGTDLTTAVDIATDALGAFKLDATAANLQLVSDMMAKTSSTANTSLQDMFEAIKFAGPGFTAAGQGVETLSAAIGTLANAGIKGSSAGTALQAVFTQLSSQAKIDKLAEIGVAVADSEGNFRNLYDILGDIENATADWGAVDRSGFINSIFGVQGAKAVNLLLAQGADALKQYEAQLKDSEGAAAQMAAVMRSSLANQIEVLKSGLTELGFKFVEAFQSRGSQGLQTIIDAVQNFDPTQLIDFLVMAFDQLVKIGGIVGQVIGFIWEFKEIILSVVLAWDVYAASVYAAALKQMVMDAAMKATPIGLVAAAIVLLIGIIMTLVTHWDSVVEVMGKVWEVIKAFGAFLWDNFMNALQAVGDFVMSIVDRFLAFWDAVKLVGQAIGTLAASLWEDFLASLQGAGDFIGDMIDKFGALFGIVGLVAGAIKGVAQNWDYVVQAFQNGGVISGLKSIGLSLLAGILAPIQSLLDMLSHIPGLGHLAGLGADKISELRSNLQSSVEASAVAPVTNRDATMLSREESVSTTNVNVSLDKGLTGTVTGTAPNVTVQRSRSGVFSAAM